MRDNKLTRRQRQVLDFITESIEERGYPPTLREIGEHLEIRSTNGVNDHLKALERKGYLVRDDLKSRALRPRGLKTDNANMVSVPLVGDVAAGDPILAIEQAEDSVQIDRFFIGSGEGVFALRIKGESMINDGIYDGDFIFVRKQLTANRGDIVVAMIEGEATVKRYYPEGDRIRFQPANDNMDPIYVHRSEFRSVDLLGIVVGVYRKM
ncbi:MAG: transcriptional repressor LexA [Myxococcales bacterium]|nr:transcriptional repressor LexA [Myxococcales bacterium]